MIPALILGLATAAPATTTPAECRTNQLSLRLDDEHGAYNGMSHSGTLLVLRNVSTHACIIAGLPHVEFRDADGKALPVIRRSPPGMHPGPVVIPVAIPAGGRASAPLRWISGDVFSQNRCFAPKSITVTWGSGATAESAFNGRLCGSALGPATYTQPPLRAGESHPT